MPRGCFGAVLWVNAPHLGDPAVDIHVGPHHYRLALAQGQLQRIQDRRQAAWGGLVADLGDLVTCHSAEAFQAERNGFEQCQQFWVRPQAKLVSAQAVAGFAFGVIGGFGNQA
ncbi:hypothetical protein D3C79_785110 [compost metagenome]